MPTFKKTEDSGLAEGAPSYALIYQLLKTSDYRRRAQVNGLAVLT